MLTLLGILDVLDVADINAGCPDGTVILNTFLSVGNSQQ